MPGDNKEVLVGVEQFIDLLIRKMAEAQLRPIRIQLQSIAAKLSRLETVVFGNGVPSLRETIDDMGDDFKNQFESLLIDFRKVKSIVYELENKDKAPVAWHEQLKGAWKFLLGLGVLLGGIAGFIKTALELRAAMNLH